MVDELEALCMGCKAHKYGCSDMGKKDLQMMMVVRPIDDSEGEEEKEEEVVKEKGEKRVAKPPAQSKKVVKAKEVKEEKPKPRPELTEKKSKAKQQSSDKEEEEDAMQMDYDESNEGEQKQKWPCLIHGEHQHKNELTFSLKFYLDFKYEHMEQDKQIVVLEAWVKAFDKVTEESTWTIPAAGQHGTGQLVAPSQYSWIT